MIVDLYLPLMNFSSYLPAAQVDGGFGMDHLEDGSYPRWAVFPVALVGQVGVLTLVKMLQCLVMKPLHFWTVQARKWLLEALRICWPGLADWGRNEEAERPSKDHSLLSSAVDLEESLLEGGFNTYDIKTEMLNPGSQTLKEGQRRREETKESAKACVMNTKVKEDLIMVPKVQLCTNPTLLCTLWGPAEEESEWTWSSQGEEHEQNLSPEEEAPDSAIEIDRASWESTPSDTESTWSDEEDSDSSDLDDENQALWDSFHSSTDPYNPLSFSSLAGSQPMAAATQEPQHIGRTGTSDHLSLCPSTALPEPDTSKHRADETDTQMQQQGLESSCRIKKVRFSPTVVVRQMRTWTFAHRMARRGPWEEMARDRCRFQKRMAEVEAAIAWCLEPRHRERVWLQEKGSHAQLGWCRFEMGSRKPPLKPCMQAWKS